MKLAGTIRARGSRAANHIFLNFWTFSNTGIKLEVQVKLNSRGYTFYPLHTGFLLGLFFDPEDGGDMFFRNVS
jgi:hypothetical protein